MIAAAIVVLREVIEAALIIGIVLAATRGVPGRTGRVGMGVAAGLAGAVVIAVFAGTIAGALEGVGQEMLNASILLAATAMLGWHNVWMKQHGADLARHMKSVGHDVSSGRRSLNVLLAVVALAVVREGSEVVLFLYGIAAGGTDSGAMLAGGLLGLAGGIAIGALLYFGLLAIPTRHVFSVTSWLLLLLAAGMAAQAAGFLVQAGKLPPLMDPLWDTSAWLPEQGVAGQVLHALMGYVDRPTGMQVAFFCTVILTLGALMIRFDRPQPRLAAGTVATLALTAVVIAVFAPSRAQAAHVVYSPVVEEGEIAIELRGHHEFDSRDDVDGGQQFKLDLEYTPTSWWRTEILGEWEREPDESLEATEVAWENVFQLTPQGKYWMDFGLLAEYAHSLEDDGEDALELGLLGEKQFASTVLTGNLIFERELEGGAETEMEYAARYRWRVSQAFEPGIELYGDLGDWGDNGQFNSHEHEAGPAVMGKLGTGNHSAFKYEAAVLFGLTEESPDTTFRFLLEYEF